MGSSCNFIKLTDEQDQDGLEIAYALALIIDIDNYKGILIYYIPINNESYEIQIIGANFYTHIYLVDTVTNVYPNVQASLYAIKTQLNEFDPSACKT